MVAVDPLASLGIFDVDVTLGGEDFRVTGHSAADWLEKIISGTSYTILPGWLEVPDDARVFTEMLLDGEFEDGEVNSVINEILGLAAGRPAWWAINLISMLVSEWGVFHGRLVMAGIFAEDLPLAAWLDAGLAAIRDHLTEPDQIRQFESQLEAMPPGTEYDEETEADAFMNLLGSGMGDM